MRKYTSFSNTYVETNHCFIKGFGWLLPAEIGKENIGVVIIKHDKEKIVRSLERIKCLPTNTLGREWLITPDLPNRLVTPPQRCISTKFTYELCRACRQPFRGRALYAKANLPQPPVPRWIQKYDREYLNWYVDEVSAFTKLYKNTFKKISYFTIETEQLNSPNQILKMLEFFNLEPESSIFETISSPTNQKK